MRRGPRPLVGWRDRTTIALVVFVIAFFVRYWWTTRIQSPLAATESDMGQYVLRAENFLAGRTPTEPRINAMYPWGAHVLIAAEFYLFGRNSGLALCIVQSFVGAIAAPCTTLLGARFVKSRIAIAIMGLLVAFWHPHFLHSGYFLSEIWFSAAISVHALCHARHAERRGGALTAGIAAAIAFVVRPQFLLTWVISIAGALNEAWRSRARRGRMIGLVALSVPTVAIVTASSIRFHKLTGHFGLISENGAMNRMFADTDVGKLEANWTAPDGSHWTYWFGPPGKRTSGPRDIVRFHGYICDPVIMDQIREDRLRGVSTMARIEKWLGNASLVVRARPWPESDHEGPKTSFRAKLQRWFADAIYPLLALAMLGLPRLRRHSPAGLVIVANIFTLPIVGALYRGEARYRVVYDPFFLLLAVLAVHSMLRFLWDRRPTRAVS